METLKQIFLLIGLLASCWIGFVTLLFVFIHKRWFPFRNHMVVPLEREVRKDQSKERSKPEKFIW